MQAWKAVRQASPASRLARKVHWAESSAAVVWLVVLEALQAAIPRTARLARPYGTTERLVFMCGVPSALVSPAPGVSHPRKAITDS
jgi:hypothetical protein